MSEAGEILKSGPIDKVADLLHKLAGPIAEEYGLMFGDKAHVWRIKNAVSCLKKTERILRDAGVSANAVPPRLFLPIMENCSVEDNETLQEMWAGLLATASQKTDSVSPSFIETLKQLTPDEARGLQRAFDRAVGHSKGQVQPRTSPLQYTFLNRMLGPTDMSPETFERLGLIRRDYRPLLSTTTDEDGVVTSVESDIGQAFLFTDYAISFLDAVRGPKPSAPPAS